MTSPAPAFDIAGMSPVKRGWELMRLLSNDGQYDEKLALDLIAAGIDTEVETEHQDRPLSKAAFSGRTAIVKALIAAKAVINARDFISYSPLMNAASGGHTESFDALVEAKAMLGLRNDFGEDAFFLAAEQGKEEIIDRLIKLNVLLEQPDDRGKTARMAAEEKGHMGVVKMIDDAIFARDLPIRQEQERQQKLLHIGDSFRDGLKVATVAPETATFRRRAKPSL